VLQALAKNVNIHINAADKESGWTPLAQALYSGNLSAAITLLQRKDCDVYQKDYDGNTPLDLLNSTIDETKPYDNVAAMSPAESDIDDADSSFDADASPSASRSGDRLDLYTWGSNANYGLCHQDGDDRAFPERVQELEVVTGAYSLKSVDEQAYPAMVAFSKFHTAIVTTRATGGNLHVAGFGECAWCTTSLGSS
jgi:hypothetical protein